MKSFKSYLTEAQDEYWITDGEYPDYAPYKGRLKLFGAFKKVHGIADDKAMKTLSTAKKHWKHYSKEDKVWIVQLKNGGEGHVVWPEEEIGRVFPNRK